MTYTFKLARRLAVSREWSMVALLVLLTACAGDTTGPDGALTGSSPERIALVPNVATIETNQKIRFISRSRYESPLSEFRGPLSKVTTWESSGGTITSDGIFSAQLAGTYKVIGRGRWKKADTSTVVVVPPPTDLTGVEISPMSVALDPGGTQTFAATGRLSDGSTTTIGVTWSATGGDIDAGGLYTAGTTAGTYRVIATSASATLADTVAVTITAPPLAPTLDQVVVKPASVSLSNGQSKQFSVYGMNSLGDSVPVQVSFAATGGTITTAGLYTAGSTGGTFRVIAREPTTGEADTSAITVSVVSSPPPSSTGMGVPYGPFALWSSSTSVKWGPVPFTGSIGASTPSGIVTQINTARQMGQKLVLFMTGGAHLNYITNGAFDMGKWKARMDQYNTSTIRNAVAQAVSDGTVVGNAMIDEPEHPSWGGVLTKPMLDEMAAYGHQYFPTLPMGVNHGPGGYKWRGTESYKVVDYVLNQYAWRIGSISTWTGNVETLAKRDGYAVGYSINILDGGVQDRDGTWDCVDEGQAGKGTYNSNCRTPADSLQRWGRTLVGHGCVLLMWTYDDAYMSRSDDQAAFKSVADSAARVPRKTCVRG
jgi:hypothetical protein